MTGRSCKTPEITEAVGAAVTMQRAMAEQAWPDGHEVRVRAGLHTGEIILTETGHVGITVHTAARIMSAAHGGQVLVSGSTQRAVAIGSAFTFRSLGNHPLRGLTGRHEPLQVEARGLMSEFPPPAV